MPARIATEANAGTETGGATDRAYPTDAVGGRLMRRSDRSAHRVKDFDCERATPRSRFATRPVTRFRRRRRTPSATCLRDYLSMEEEKYNRQYRRTGDALARSNAPAKAGAAGWKC